MPRPPSLTTWEKYMGIRINEPTKRGAEIEDRLGSARAAEV